MNVYLCSNHYSQWPFSIFTFNFIFKIEKTRNLLSLYSMQELVRVAKLYYSKHDSDMKISCRILVLFGRSLFDLKNLFSHPENQYKERHAHEAGKGMHAKKGKACKEGKGMQGKGKACG